VRRFAQLSKPSPKDTSAILAFAEKEATSVATLVADHVIKKTKGQVAPPGMKRLTINLPEELHKKLRMKSVQDGTTATEIIVELLKTSMK
jgi:hypothetical protein